MIFNTFIDFKIRELFYANNFVHCLIINERDSGQMSRSQKFLMYAKKIQKLLNAY